MRWLNQKLYLRYGKRRSIRASNSPNLKNYKDKEPMPHFDLAIPPLHTLSHVVFLPTQLPPDAPPPDEPDNAVVAYIHQHRYPTNLLQPRRQRPAPALSPTSLTPPTAFIAFQHFTRVGNLRRAFDKVQSLLL
ncbi:hypothetical protein L2E82_12151 [Cichorium intybus]|uniref:Uncharacterized protein n=1 Tax=Cichorium intybus TaxID=13427 RepID=A0ACB9GGE2_CICIN|nr:hypothetical protein L2E82_12151 [Cichorium intybus]